MCAKLSDLIPDQEPKRLATGLQFTEGPVWNPEGYLLFSDIPANIIYRWAQGESAKPHITPSGQSNGLTYDKQGRLIACEHAGRRVSRMDSNGEMATVVGSYQGTELNSPNDVVVHSNGSIYFTDPPYGRLPELGELGFFGVYRIDLDGSLHLLLDDMVRPNGLAFSPDESVLYIDDSQHRHTRVFDLQSDGSLANGRLFMDMDVEAQGNPDGMKIDVEGNVYITGGGGLWVIDPSGNHLGTFPLPEIPSNIAFGGPDNRTLYITARTSVYSLEGNVPGMKTY